MTADGVVAADGAPLTAGEVKALFHVEKYARGGTRRRRPGMAPDPDAPRFRRRRAAQVSHPGGPRPAPPAPASTPWVDRMAERERAREEATGEERPKVRHRPGMRD
jgi:hypothetical protein